MLRLSLAAFVLAAASIAQQPSVWLPGATVLPQTVLHVGDVMHVFTVQSDVVLTRSILYHRSLDGGRTFEPVRYLATSIPATLASDTNLVGDGTVLMYSIGTAVGPAVVVSSDAGATWSLPIQITAQPRTATAATLLHSLGVTFAVWVEPRVGPGDVYAAQSFDGGATWQPDVRIDTGPDLESRYPQLFGDVSGVYVQWTEWPGLQHRWQTSFDLGASWLAVPQQLPGVPGMRAATGLFVTAVLGNQLQFSLDGAATWTPAAFQPGPGTNPRFDLDGPFGVAAWNTGPQVFTAETQDFGMTWSPHGVNLMAGVNATFVAGVVPAVHGTAAAVGITYHDGNTLTYRSLVHVSGNLGRTWRANNVSGWQTQLDILVQPHASGNGIVACSKSLGTVRAALVCGSQPYGAGSPGSGGIEPRLRHGGVPALGQTITWAVDQCLGGAPVVLGYSFAGGASMPFQGITVLLNPPLELLLQFSDGALGVPGAGITSYGFTLPELPVLIGVRTNWQAAVLDVGMPLGFAATAGYEMWMN